MSTMSVQVGVLISMATFALAACITPGPVNVVALSCGAQFGTLRSQRHALGAALGFAPVMLLTGFGLHELLQKWPSLTEIIRWAGIAFLVYLAYKIAADDGSLDTHGKARQPSLWHAATMQMLNPKGWLSAMAGMGAFVADGDALLIWLFCLITFVICYLSVACWVYAGGFLGKYLSSPARVRLFNRLMAILLAGCAVSLAFV